MLAAGRAYCNAKVATCKYSALNAFPPMAGCITETNGVGSCASMRAVHSVKALRDTGSALKSSRPMPTKAVPCPLYMNTNGENPATGEDRGG